MIACYRMSGGKQNAVLDRQEILQEITALRLMDMSTADFQKFCQDSIDQIKANGGHPILSNGVPKT